jgi:DNA mismatch repair protein PMS2
VVFSTQGHATTRENIANVFSAKAVASLLLLDLKFELQPSTLPSQSARNWSTQNDVSSREVQLIGHISRPVVGEGRQTPDRQMFFVNSRPCQLPQVAKAINEVYRSYNVTQSPFIFADLVMDTNSYDVNVSPDKRTILLHDQIALLEALKSSLTSLFEAHDQSVPQANSKLPAYKLLTVNRALPRDFKSVDAVSGDKISEKPMEDEVEDESDDSGSNATPPTSMMRKFVGRTTVDRETVQRVSFKAPKVKIIAKSPKISTDKISSNHPTASFTQDEPLPRPVQDFNEVMGVTIVRNEPELNILVEPNVSPSRERQVSSEGIEEQRSPRPNRDESDEEEPIAATQPGMKVPQSGDLRNAFERMRPPRLSEETATITIGNITTTAKIGSPSAKRRRADFPVAMASKKQISTANPILLKSLRSFAAPGSQLADLEMNDVDLTAAALPHAIKIGSSATIDSDDLEDDGPPVAETVFQVDEGSQSDEEYVDDDEKKKREEAKVAKLVADAEATAARPTDDNMKRATSVLKSRARKEATLQILQRVSSTTEKIAEVFQTLLSALEEQARQDEQASSGTIKDKVSAEERLALTVSKSDFGRMRIVGQFNLGFVLAVRPPASNRTAAESSLVGRNTDELFIIDQHASDEKYNFERLQAITVVQNQPLVHPKRLDLTAVDEEIIMHHSEVLTKNGFNIDVDLSGEYPVGQRCRLISLPMSKEVVFDGRDLEELLSLLADQAGSDVPRPSKVRRMFAMRACRSSIMVGKTLTGRQMETVVRHMGEIDKPWNCPHGRPTMRHLYGLNSWQGWQEGDGLLGMEESEISSAPWTRFVNDFDIDADGDGEDESDEESMDE